jgi:hypothetical protein
LRIGNVCGKDHDSYQKTFERLLRDLKAKSKDKVAAAMGPGMAAEDNEA